MSLHANILEDEAQIADVVRGLRRVAVLGIKTEAQQGQPAFDVAKVLADGGIEIVPVPVFYPDVTTILGKPVFRKVADVPGELDCVDVFRKPSDLPPHLPDLLEKHPKVVWLQLGIRNDEFATKLAEAGIKVIQDRCLKVDFRRWRGE